MNQKYLQIVLSVGCALFLLGCGALASTPTLPPPTPTDVPPTLTPVPTSTAAPTPTLTPTSTPTEVVIKLTTSAGDIILTKAEIVDENPLGQKALPGYQILNVTFKSVDGSEIDGTEFYNASRAVYVKGEDGSKTTSYMGGLVDGELMVGFTPPLSAHEFTLFWPGNDPIELDLSQ